MLNKIKEVSIMELLISFILRNKSLVVGLLLLAALGGCYIYIDMLKSDAAKLIAEKNVVIVELQASQAALQGIQSAIKEQNSAVEKLKTDAEARVAAGQAEITQAKVTSELYRRKASDLMKVKPDPKLSRCDAANALINSEIGNAN
jgi:hypothetical protein